MEDRHRTGMVRRLPVPLWDRLRGICSGTRVLDPRETMTRAGEPLHLSTLLLDGLMARHKRGGGERQMVALQVPGDFVDLHGLPLGALDHDVAAVGRAEVALFEHGAIEALMAEDAEQARELWALTMIDAAIHRHWTFRMGSLRAMAGMANFLSELQLRLTLAGRTEGSRFPLPLTQAELGDICGISAVHVNRVLRDLREAGLCTLQGSTVEVHDLAGLNAMGRFEPDYLFLPWEG